MAARVFGVCVLASVLLSLGATSTASALDSPSVVVTTATAATPSDTVNPFLPEDRAISDCISAVPKPGCGSEARGGWHQYLVAIALVGGLTFVGWRIIAGVRRSPNRAAK